MADEAWFNTWFNDFLARAKKYLDDNVRSGKMTAEEATAALESVMKAQVTIREKSLPDFASAIFTDEVEYCEGEMVPSDSPLFQFVAFAAKLKARQGTSMPDFAALYGAKYELDRKFFGPKHSPPETPP
jgi:hypothetical protein